MPIQIDSEFPGGNIRVEEIRGDQVRLHQDLRDTAQDWFYWCFRLCGAEGRTVHFNFTQSRAIGVRGPAVSLDSGNTWHWLGVDLVEDNSFTFPVPLQGHEVRLSFAMPYQESHWRHFMGSFHSNPAVSRHRLCLTAKGREVEYVILGCPEAKLQHRVVITCRHHCCEMMGNYALEGLVRWVTGDTDRDAQWLRENVQLFLVPFTDLDGVEDGDQGKGRQPRDHGRDYEGESLYTVPRTLRELLPVWGGDLLRVGLDLHCPWISGEHNEVIYLVGSKHRGIAQEQRRFSDLLEAVRKGRLPFLAEDFLPFGEAWNTPANYTDGKGFSDWVAELPGMGLGTSIEIPYASARGMEVNQGSARLFGRDLGRALAVYLRKAFRPGSHPWGEETR